MSGGRTYWWAKDAAWWRRELIVELGEEFGSAGPAVIDWLCCEAKAQNDGGRVKAGYRSTARGSFVELVTVRNVVSRAAALGVLDDYEDGERGRFTCRLSGWAADQERGRGAIRVADHREKKNARVFQRDDWRCVACGDTQNLTVDHILARSRGGTDDAENLQTLCGSCNSSKKDRDAPSNRVVNRHAQADNNGGGVTVSNAESPTGQNRDKGNPPNPPQAGGRKRDRDRQEEWVESFAEGWDDPGLAARAARQALRSAGCKDADAIRAHIAQWYPDLVEQAAA